jgi:4-deoxy-L-threo-5-hexosulose-uronate ketol-isomerase
MAGVVPVQFVFLIPMKVIHAPSPHETSILDTAGLRDSFLLEELFKPGELTLVYTDLDRAIVGSVVPTSEVIKLAAGAELRAEYFCERREIGILNFSGKGIVSVDGTAFDMEKCDCLYIGRGSKEIHFASADASAPAEFYLISYPAHAAYPTTKATPAEANRVELGSKEECNERTICQYIHENGIKSCQLVMGYTEFKAGSVWNTMPAHTHLRRSEVYCYFDVPAAHAVLHMMGEPDETRPLWVHDKQAVLSPAWSIHCGCGTAAYRFVWAMGGENQAFTDMDKVGINELR